jgi:hypothetical protein
MELTKVFFFDFDKDPLLDNAERASKPFVCESFNVATISLLISRSSFNFCRISSLRVFSNSLNLFLCTRYYGREKQANK